MQIECTLRDQLAIAAPAAEINNMFPESRIDAAQFLGVEVFPDDGYAQCVAKARYMWADAMLKAREAGKEEK